MITKVLELILELIIGIIGVLPSRVTGPDEYLREG